VTPSQTVGGFIASPPEDSKLEYFWAPLSGWMYPGYAWQAEVLWGAATLYHVDEESLWASGVWKPRDNYHFLEHDSQAPLPHVGGYGGGWSTLGQLLNKQQDGELLSGRIHTATIFVAQSMLLAPGYAADFEMEVQAAEAAGEIQWVGLAEVIDIWHSEYDSLPSILTYLPQAVICGDADANDIVNISDVVYLISFIFGGGPPPEPLLAADVDCNEIVNISDAVYLIAYVFGGGPEPCDPDGNGVSDC
jgi:hypothetical protein